VTVYETDRATAMKHRARGQSEEYHPSEPWTSSMGQSALQARAKPIAIPWLSIKQGVSFVCFGSPHLVHNAGS
jgi:hypothetical protein